MNPRQQLEASLRSGRVSHAYLLVGQQAERQEVAEQVARAYLCWQQGREDRAVPCGSCLSCRLAQAGTNADLRHWEPERGTWRIEQVRALIQEAWRQPTLGSRRVHILADVQTLTLPSANALLKLLEEPPGGSLFLLLADASAGLPVTLISRCQTVNWPSSPSPLAGGDRLWWAVGEGVARGKGAHLLALARELAEAGENVVLSLCQGWRQAFIASIGGVGSIGGVASIGDVGSVGGVGSIGGVPAPLDLEGWPPARWSSSALLRAWEASERLARRLQAPVNARLSWEWFLLEVAEIGAGEK